MKDLQYFMCKAIKKFLPVRSDIVNNFFRKNGITLGNNVRINSNILTIESYLISIGDNTTISDHVSFVTHDNSISKALNGGVWKN